METKLLESGEFDTSRELWKARLVHGTFIFTPLWELQGFQIGWNRKQKVKPGVEAWRVTWLLFTIANTHLEKIPILPNIVKANHIALAREKSRETSTHRSWHCTYEETLFFDWIRWDLKDSWHAQGIDAGYLPSLQMTKAWGVGYKVDLIPQVL